MSSEKNIKERPSMRAVLKEFSQNTTAHGLSQIHIADNWFWRIIWVLAVCGGVFMVVWQSTELIITYTEKPVKTSIEVAYSQAVNFPMVTICNLNSIKISRLKDFPRIMDTWKKYDTIKSSNTSLAASQFITDSSLENTVKKGITRQKDGKATSSSMDDIELDGDDYVKDNIIDMISSEKKSKLSKAGHPFKELVYRCAWNGFSCDKGDFLQYWRQTWNWRYGNCFTFNTGSNENGTELPVMSITKSGPLFGLVLDLFINQDEYFSVLSQEAGVKVLLTDQNQIPFPTTQGFTVAPGASSSIGVRKYIIHRIDPFDNGTCYSADTPETTSIYSDIKGARYSVQGCMNSCLAKNQQDKCNCTEGKYRSSKEETICMSPEQVACKIDVIKAYQNSSLGCTEQCPQPCRYSSYRVSVSNAEWSQAYEKDFQRKLMKDYSSKGFDKKFGMDRSMMKQNFLRVKIYFEELNLEKITYSRSYQLEDLLSDIGGQLGLWIGISALTCFEIVKLLLDLLSCLGRKVCWVRQNKQVSGSTDSFPMS